MAKIQNKSNSNAIWVEELKKCIVFKDNIAETNDKKEIAWFKNHGYVVTEDAVKPLSTGNVSTIVK